MLTVFLKHDQSRPLSALKAQLAKQEFHTVFPPAGVEVVSWNITMGIGQVIVPRLAEVTLARAAVARQTNSWKPHEPSCCP